MVYDSFYKNSQIIYKSAKFGDVINYFIKSGVPLEKTFLGYLYLVELAILNIARNIEDLIEDDSLSERIQWGEITVEDREVRKELETHPEGRYIIDLMSVRKKLSGMRFKPNYNEADITTQLSSLREIIAKFDESVKERFAITRLNEDRALENRLTIQHICYNYALIRFEPAIEPFPPTPNYEVPIYPGLAFFNLMPKSQQCNYVLQHTEIKKHKNNYLKGYSTSLSYLYSSFASSKVREINKRFSDADSWEDIHNIGEALLEDFNIEKKTNRRLFEADYHTSVKPLEKNEIERYVELRQVLRDRCARVFPNWDLDESIFIHYLIGAIERFKHFNCCKPTLIKFETDTESDYCLIPIRYYAIFNPMRGWISDGSHWLVFRNDSEHTSFADIMVREILEKNADELDYVEYAIDENLMKKYLNTMTYGTKRETREVEIKKASRGLLGEFLAAFYILKECGAEKLLALDVHHQIQDTDIDVFAETDEQVIIVQVKSSLSSKLEDNKSILKNFEKTLKHLQNKTKKHRMILFLMHSEIPDSEIGTFLLEDIKVEELEAEATLKCVEPDIAQKKREIENYFKQHDVEIILLDDITKKLGTEKCYQDLIDKLRLIFTEEERIPFNPEYFLWLDNYKLLLDHPDS